MKRRHVTKRGSRKLFKKTALRTNAQNVRPEPMRGGIRH